MPHSTLDRRSFLGALGTLYYFPGYPEAPPDAYVYSLKNRALRLGLEVSASPRAKRRD